MAEKRCLVAICHNLPAVLRGSAQSLMEMGWGDRVAVAKEAHGVAAIDFAWYFNYPRVDALRDCAASDAIKDGYTHILYLDADMIWPSNVLWKMLKHADDTRVVGGHYVMKHQPYGAVALLNKHRQPGSNVDVFEHADLRNVRELVEVDVVGMGCTLVPVALIEAMGERPWFEYKDDDEGWPRVTEDVAFCLRAKEVGGTVWVDPTVQCGHLVTQVIDHRWTNRHRLVVEETAKHMTMTTAPAVEGHPV